VFHHQILYPASQPGPPAGVPRRRKRWIFQVLQGTPERPPSKERVVAMETKQIPESGAGPGAELDHTHHVKLSKRRQLSTMNRQQRDSSSGATHRCGSEICANKANTLVTSRPSHSDLQLAKGPALQVSLIPESPQSATTNQNHRKPGARRYHRAHAGRFFDLELSAITARNSIQPDRTQTMRDTPTEHVRSRIL